MTVQRALTAVMVLAVVGLGGAWGFGSLIARPSVHPIPPPAHPGTVVKLVAIDGVRIEGSFWPGRTRDGAAVLLLHGINSSRSSFDRHARWLNSLGYAVLAIDLRGHGGSQPVPRTFGLYEARDAAAALAFLRANSPHRPVGVIGTSLGGAAALLGDSGPLPVQAMVLQAVYPDLRRAIDNRITRVAGWPVARLGEPFLSYQSWPRYGVPPERISPAKALRRFNSPVLIVGGRNDVSTTVADTELLYRAAAGPKQLWIVDGLGHAGTGSLFDDEYRSHVGALLEDSLGRP